MGIFGIYGIHTVEACPMNNPDSAKAVMQMSSRINEKRLLENHKINRILGQYHSALEHTFVWIVEAKSAHLIERFYIDSDMSKFNAVKIVPLTLFEELVRKCSVRLTQKK
jgi:hypothetical protein